MPFLFLKPITNIGVYQDQDCMEDNPTIHSLDNDISSYSASIIRDHFDTSAKVADCCGNYRLKFCVKIKHDDSAQWVDLEDYDYITDEPVEEQK